MSDVRRRWDMLDDTDESDDADGRTATRNRRAGGLARAGVVAVIVIGVWLVLAYRNRQQDSADADSVVPPRAVISVPEGFRPDALVEPELDPTFGSQGTWALLAGPDARLADGPWMVVSCRTPGRGEVGSAGEIVTGTLGSEVQVDTTDDDGVRVVAAESGDVSAAVVIDRSPTTMVTVIASGWDGELGPLARQWFDLAANGDDPTTCAGVPASAESRTGLPLRQARQLGAPIVPLGLRLVSAGDTAVAWTNGEAGSRISLTSLRAGTGGDDADLAAFLRPTGVTEGQELLGDTPAWGSTLADGTHLLLWVDDGVVRAMSAGPAAGVDLAEVAASVHEPSPFEWAAVVEAVAG